MFRKRAILFFALLAGTAAAIVALQGKPADQHVGDRTAAGVVVPTGRVVAAGSGQTIDLKSAVVDCVLTADESEAIVKTSDSVAVVSVADGKQLSAVTLPGGASLTGIALSPDGKTVACSNAGSEVQLFSLNQGILAAAGSIQLPKAQVGGESYPCGLQFLSMGQLAVAASRDNSVMIVDIGARKVSRRIAVDTAPYSVLGIDSSHLLVTCWAGPSLAGEPTAPSSGTNVQVDKRGTAVGGSLCRLDLGSGTVSQRAPLPLQPTEILSGSGHVFVACANGDAVLVLDPASLAVTNTIRAGKLSGSAPNSIALAADGKTLYVAWGGLDRVGAYDLKKGSWTGFMRTEWYPSDVRAARSGLIVATAKGIGSRGRSGSKHSVYDVTSSISCIPKPVFDAKLPSESLDGPARAGIAAAPIPARTGEPSLIKHVVYVIKENRTYDQLLGDMKEGNGDPSLTLYGEQVTPNHHAIARSFVLLDNYYCNGILSADGHAWATEANATTYYERSRGGWTRSYPFGDDPLATSASGYLWDNALDHGRSVRNFGEFDYASPSGSEGAFEILHNFLAGKHEEFKQNIGVARLRAVSERDYPGWNLEIPDVLRADRFARRLKELEESGDMADLTIVYLPQDHTSGGSAGYPSPRAQVADNDQGVGRVVDALSHSKFWASSAVFIEEDDPQNGFDHVDGHRSLCLLAGPYVRRGVVVSRFYNQASVIHTIERILGLPPMNVNDAEAPVMAECFQSSADTRGYRSVANTIPLDEKPAMHSTEVFDLSKPDQVDDDLFNRQLWALSGKKGVYPQKASRVAGGDGVIGRKG
jgi:DNA-binding beta-propeller fold protein YncE